MKKQKKTDRRIQRTRKLLLDSLIALILEKGYDPITVQDIVDHANIGRSTFYSHFENKEQLLFNGHLELMQLVFNTSERSLTNGLDFHALYAHTKQHGMVAKAMLGKNGGNLVVNQLQEATALKLLQTLRKKSVADEILLKIKAEATASALIRLLTCWLDNDMSIAQEKMVVLSEEIYDKLIGSS